ncbi:MAG: hypothetical protein AAB874_07455 [Patescibacteria group bacterium]
MAEGIKPSVASVLKNETAALPTLGISAPGLGLPFALNKAGIADISNLSQFASLGLAAINLRQRAYEKPAKNKLELTWRSVQDAAVVFCVHTLPILWHNFSPMMEGLSQNQLPPETFSWMAAAFVFGLGGYRTGRIALPPVINAIRFIHAHWPRPKPTYPRFGTLGISRDEQVFVDGKRLTPPQYNSSGKLKSDLEIMADQQGEFLDSGRQPKNDKE